MKTEDKNCASYNWGIRIKKGLEQNLQLLPGHQSATELQTITLISTAQSNRRVLCGIALICC